MAEEKRRKGFQDVRDAAGRLLFRYDRERDIIEVKPFRSQPARVDMREVREQDKKD